jgi:hypothetical protein
VSDRVTLLCIGVVTEALVTAGSGDQEAAAGRAGPPASHADRERAIDMLKAGYVQGRLTRDELDVRVGDVFASGISADLAALTADLPPGLSESEPPQMPRGAQGAPPGKTAVIWGACGIIPLAVLVSGLPASLPHTAKLPLLVGIVLYLTVWVAGFLWFDSQDKKRSRGQLPARPG